MKTRFPVSADIAPLQPYSQNDLASRTVRVKIGIFAIQFINRENHGRFKSFGIVPDNICTHFNAGFCI